MRAKIIAYNYDETQEGFSDFSMNCYWGNSYQNVFYLCGDFGRSTFEDIIETETDSTGQTKRTQNTSIERFNLVVVATTPLLQFLKSIDKHDVKIIELMDTGAQYTIRNIDIDDEGDKLTPNFLVNINFEDEPITKIQSNIYAVDDQKIAYFDNNGDGTPDINGDAEYQAVTGAGFTTYQLYYESDGVTPAVSGDVNLFVYAIASDGFEALVGVFRGQFGDSWNDATKWQSTQQIWNYFAALTTVGHGNIMLFDKQGFSEDNGYLSDEQEERAVQVRFELQIDGGGLAKTTMQKVYTIWGGFHGCGVQVFATGEYGLTTIGQIDRKNTLQNLQDVRTDVSGGTAINELIRAFTLTATTNFSNKYTIDVLPNNNEWYFKGVNVSKGGYISENNRAAEAKLNYVFALDSAVPITHDDNVLAFTTGSTPYDFTFDWKFDKQGTAFTNIGDVGTTATVYLDGAVVTTIPAIVAGLAPVLLTGSQTITLPDTNKHEVELSFVTTNGYDILVKFEVQIKPYF